jgi:hypothetical protein
MNKLENLGKNSMPVNHALVIIILVAVGIYAFKMVQNLQF